MLAILCAKSEDSLKRLLVVVKGKGAIITKLGLNIAQQLYYLFINTIFLS